MTDEKIVKSLADNGYEIIRNDKPKEGFKAVHIRKNGVNHYYETLEEAYYLEVLGID